MGRVLFLYGQSPYLTGAPEISELTRSSRTCVAATQGALPGALIKLTCALITPRLSPISSSLESCLLHPCLRRSKPPPPPPDADRATVLFAGQEHAVSLWGSCTRQSRIKPDSGLHRRPTGKGCTANITQPLLPPALPAEQHAQLSGSRYPTEHKLCTPKNTTNLGISTCRIFMKRSFLSGPVLIEILTCLLGEFFQSRTLPPYICTDPSISEP